ncbi:hypothetical protein F2P56_014252 [Juglans regia]|uniref:RNase H type-1 domain-containing protein n=2 Tax=Juglans regia TaxID=51240 RepID=A0A834CS43_JUGRE|nr:uncharacterized protein LOC108979195 [Juglans regia]KAF5464150.1 hypothetical protein F2P56_014252 [Juglans regia]
MARFWWKQGKKESGIHWKSWEKLGVSKTASGLGFGDMENFNKAMLAKQGWRLMRRENSLVAKFFKEKYFKNSKYTDAKLGVMPSYIWRSLLSVQEVVKNGERWRVGDGKDIRIWGKKWLPMPTSFSVRSPVNLLSPDAKVSELIDEENMEWETELIRDIFSKEEAYKQIWGPTKDGKYSIRSAYHAENQMCKDRKGQGSSTEVENERWKNALVSLDEFQEAQRESRSDGRKMGLAQQRRSWQKPEQPSVKVNFDTTLDLKEKRIGAEVVIRDCRGDVLISLCAQLLYVTSHFLAECKAFGRAIELCKELGFYTV